MPHPSRTQKPRKFKALGNRSLVIGALAVAAVATAVPVAGGFGEGRPLEGGERNPSPNQSRELRRETEIIANTSTYGTRQSNKSRNGGGAIYGCRSGAGGTGAKNEPCIRANNLSQGFAFELVTKGAVAGLVTAGKGGPNTKPLVTNATGVADGLNADFVDGQESDAAAVAATGQVETKTTEQITAAKTATGTYQVDFPTRANAICVYQATVRSGPAFVVAQGQPEPNGRVVVTTYTATGTEAGGGGGTAVTGPRLADTPFYVTAQCTSQAASTTG
ncbi:MAG TPA: hypothetical protein VGR11_15290 [Solirubrobacteraceae bacterium]|nr:hypothetical protein [Solirubrobacteraceae bacterium]